MPGPDATERHSSPLATLARGDAIGVIASGFAVQPRKLRDGLRRLDRWGYRIVCGPHLDAQDGYFAGGDVERGRDLCAMLESSEIRAVWFARGGFGTARLLDQIRWDRVPPKLLVGYSDLTALFAVALAHEGLRCLHGPLVVELGDPREFDCRSLTRCLQGETFELKIAARQVLVSGRARGRLVGGNLSVLTHLWGTPYAPDLSGRILLLEEVGEETYRIDRLLTQLRMAGAFENLAGVLLGGVSVPVRRRFPPDRDLMDLLAENFGSLGIPVVQGLRCGHVARRLTLPLGGVTSIDTSRRLLTFEP